MKQNILFYWLEDNERLDYSKCNEVFEFCNKNGYVAKWQKSKLKDEWTGNPVKGCWSIGVFELDNYLENVENIINFGLQYFCNPPTKITKSRNDVQLRDILKNRFIRRLKDIDNELKNENKRKNKRNLKFIIDDVMKDEDFAELEDLYKYKLNPKEIFDIEKTVYGYIRKYPYLKEHFNLNDKPLEIVLE